MYCWMLKIQSYNQDECVMEICDRRNRVRIALFESCSIFKVAVCDLEEIDAVLIELVD